MQKTVALYSLALLSPGKFPADVHKTDHPAGIHQALSLKGFRKVLTIHVFLGLFVTVFSCIVLDFHL